MPFPAFDLFAPIIALDPPGFFRGFHTLAVHDGRRGISVAARPQADRAAQRLMHPLPDAVQTPLAPCRIRGLPRRILPWEIAPGTAGTQHIEEGVDEQSQRPGAWPAAPRWRWQQRRQISPLGICEVTGIEGASIHGRARHRRYLLRKMRVGGLWHALGCMGTRWSHRRGSVGP